MEFAFCQCRVYCAQDYSLAFAFKRSDVFE